MLLSPKQWSTRALQAFELQRQIQKESNKVNQQALKLCDLTKQWVAVLGGIDNSLKRYGDFELFLQVRACACTANAYPQP